ncbi:hypothetical protein [Sneathiella sp. HT1-7]|uniref:hypothetical protein n=1 Tax=Sneathiella sp. HT1-7 TaxID=2887192 RepID=UPI001D15A377|nr:hypothetical protein [Sneathiella sp. HT1-7]MCC3304820.1 hypothetical protein [Sneathiella sp. HT1-7]
MPHLSDLKAKLTLLRQAMIKRAKTSSRTERLIFAAPFLAALFFAGVTLLLDIFLRDMTGLGWIFSLLGTAGLLLVFFAPLTFVSVRLYNRIWHRRKERRFMDALFIGLYLPHAFAVLIVVISQLEGSENIISLGAAVITWAMLSLLLSPFTVLLTLLLWSYLPKEIRVPTQLLQLPSRLNARGQTLLAPPSETTDESDALRT